MRPVEIIGGGLAGLSLGIGLRQKEIPVTLREAGNYPRHKVCGEFINGVTVETLEALGIGSIFQNALRHSYTQWWIGNRKVLEAEMEHPALGMSRWEMDEALRELFEKKGGELHVKDRVSPEPQEGRVWTAGRVLDKESKWLGLKAHFEGVELSGCLEMHLGEGGYVGLTPINSAGDRINVCGLFHRKKLKGDNLLLAYLQSCGLERLAKKLAEGEMDDQSLTGISGFALGNQRASDELCSLGDSERMIPPFTGNGMSMAFEAAECALLPLENFAIEESDWENCRLEIRQLLEQRFRQRVSWAMTLHRFLTTRLGRVGLGLACRSGILPFHWLHRRLS